MPASKHTLHVIGWIGSKHAYLDVSLEEAIERYKNEEGIDCGIEHVVTFAFDDMFYVYDAWGSANTYESHTRLDTV